MSERDDVQRDEREVRNFFSRTVLVGSREENPRRAVELGQLRVQVTVGVNFSYHGVDDINGPRIR